MSTATAPRAVQLGDVYHFHDGATMVVEEHRPDGWRLRVLDHPHDFLVGAGITLNDDELRETIVEAPPDDRQRVASVAPPAPRLYGRGDVYRLATGVTVALVDPSRSGWRATVVHSIHDRYPVGGYNLVVSDSDLDGGHRVDLAAAVARALPDGGA